MMAVNRPAPKARLTPSSARTSVSPEPYTFTRSVTVTAGRVGVEVGTLVMMATLGARAGAVVAVRDSPAVRPRSYGGGATIVIRSGDDPRCPPGVALRRGPESGSLRPCRIHGRHSPARHRP